MFPDYSSMDRATYVQMCNNDFHLEKQMINFCVEYYDQLADGNLNNDTLQVQNLSKEIFIPSQQESHEDALF